jgi:hypothetical protein
MSGKSKKGADIWNHFNPCWCDSNNSNTPPSLTKPTDDLINKYERRRMCKKCNIHVLDHPKNGYRHIKNCENLDSEERVAIIRSCNAKEVTTYEEYWNKSKIYILYLRLYLIIGHLY